MLFDLPSYSCLNILKAWLSISDFCVLDSAVYNKELRKEKFHYLLSICKENHSTAILQEHGVHLTIKSSLLGLRVSTFAVFGNTVCAKTQFETFEQFHARNKLERITCITPDCSIGQLLEPSRRTVEGSIIEYFMWEPESCKSDYHVFKTPDNCFASRRNSFEISSYTGYMVYHVGARSFSFKGNAVNNKLHGFGKLEYSNHANNKISIYEGNFETGSKCGFGKAIYKNGDVYSGEWLNGKQNGQGEMKYANGNIYAGEWQNDEHHGTGTLKYASGSVYSGEWESNLFHGEGEMKSADGNYFKGKWDKGKSVWMC